MNPKGKGCQEEDPLTPTCKGKRAGRGLVPVGNSAEGCVAGCGPGAGAGTAGAGAGALGLAELMAGPTLLVGLQRWVFSQPYWAWVSPSPLPPLLFPMVISEPRPECISRFSSDFSFSLVTGKLSSKYGYLTFLLSACCETPMEFLCWLYIAV